MSLWMYLLRIPKQQQSKSLALCSVCLCPARFLFHLLVLCLLFSISLFFTCPAHSPSHHCPPPFQLQTRKTPEQLASEHVSRPVSQSAVQRALPITNCFFSCCSAGLFPLHKCYDVPAGVQPIHIWTPIPFPIGYL